MSKRYTFHPMRTRRQERAQARQAKYDALTPEEQDAQKQTNKEAYDNRRNESTDMRSVSP